MDQGGPAGLAQRQEEAPQVIHTIRRRHAIVGATIHRRKRETMLERVLKVAAKRVGLSFEDYSAKRAAGLKHCTGCKEWREASFFQKDLSRGDGLKARCRPCSARHTPEPRPRVNPITGRPGPAQSPPRDGDKKQARRKVNLEVERGRMPHPNTLACVDCGHIGPERRHEYDHHQGYAAEHHYDVVPVCTTCHSKRTFSR